MSSIDDTHALLDQVTWVRGLAGTLVVDSADADDAAQEAWLQVLRKPPGSDSNPRGFLAQVLRRTASKQRRGERRRSRREQEVATSDEIPVAAADLVARAEMQQALVEQVLDLPEAQRDVVLLRFFEGLPPRDIAKRQGVPVATVRTRLQRGLRGLRDRLGSSPLGEHWRDSLALAFFPAGIPTFVPSVAGATAASGLTSKTVLTMQVTKKSVALLGLIASLGLGLPLSYATGLFDGADSAPREDMASLRGGAETDSDGLDLESKSAVGRGGDRERIERFSSARVDDEDLEAGEASVVAARAVFAGRVVDLEGRGVSGVLVHWRSGGTPEFSDTVDDWIGDGVDSIRMTEDRWGLLQDPARAEALLADRADPAAWKARLLGRPTEGRGVLSRADGSFDLRVAPSAPEGGEPRIVDPSYIEVVRANNDEGLVFVVAPALRLEGRVVDGVGRPVAGAAVSLEVPELDGRFEALAESLPQFRTRTDGRFVLRGVPFVAGASLRATHVRLGETSDPVAGSDRRDLELRLPERDQSVIDVVGRVVDEKGQPIGGARVRFGRRTVRTSTETGEFRVAGPRRIERVFVTAEGHRPISASIGLAADPTASESPILIVLDGAPLKISGIVVDEEGNPIAGASINTPDAEFPDSGFSSIEASTRGGMAVQTGPGGYFELSGLQDRSYRLRVYELNDLSNLRYQITEPLAAGSELLRIVLPRLRMQPRELRIVDQNGAPIEGLEVRAGLTTVQPKYGWMGETTPVLARTDAEGRTGSIPLPVGFGFVEFLSEELGEQRVPIASVGEVVTLRRPIEVALRAGEGTRVDWVVFHRGLEEVEIRTRSGDERRLIRPTGRRFPVCLVPEDVTHLEWFDGRTIHGMPVELQRRESGARRELVIERR